MTQGDANTSSESAIAKTSKIIAFILLGIYGIALITIGVVAAIKPSPEDQAWVELLKSGFLILGGGLTTVIGYYFGSRDVQEAQTSADEARRLKEEVAAERWKLAAMLNPTYDEVSLKGPEEMPDIIEPDETSESGEQSDTSHQE